MDWLPIDNLLSAQVVTATGELVSASPSEHPDLFWGLRGGGGNFGVVVALYYRTLGSICFLTETIPKRGQAQNLTLRRIIAQAREELDPEHEVQLFLRGSGYRPDKLAFFFCCSIGFDKLFRGYNCALSPMKRLINSSHHFTLSYKISILSSIDVVYCC